MRDDTIRIMQEREVCIINTKITMSVRKKTLKIVSTERRIQKLIMNHQDYEQPSPRRIAVETKENALCAAMAAW